METHLQEHQADNSANTLEDAADVPSTPSSQSSESSQFVPAILPDLSPCQRIIFWVLFCLVWLTLAGVRVVQVLSQLQDTHSVIEFPLFLVPMLLFGVPATCIQIFNAYPFPKGLGRVPAALILTYGPSSCVVIFICMTCFACTGQPWYWLAMAYSAYCLGFCSSIVCRALTRAQAHAA